MNPIARLLLILILLLGIGLDFAEAADDARDLRAAIMADCGGLDASEPAAGDAETPAPPVCLRVATPRPARVPRASAPPYRSRALAPLRRPLPCRHVGQAGVIHVRIRAQEFSCTGC